MRDESCEVKCSTALQESSRHYKRQTFEGPSLWNSLMDLRSLESTSEHAANMPAQVRSADGLLWR